MKKFKHIPTNLVYNFEIKPNTGMPVIFQSVTDGIEIFSGFVINCKDWQEIKEPEYTILSYLRNSDYIIKKVEKGKYKNSWNFGYAWSETPPECNSNTGIVIYSVRRESNGKIFTVGDTVRSNFNKESVVKTINKIALETIRGSSEKLYIYTDGEQSTINNYVKVKPKEWEITAFRSLTKKGVFFTEIDKYYDVQTALDKPKIWEIYSVKRFSDGIEFKIGDRTQFGLIKGFYIAVDGIIEVYVGKSDEDEPLNDLKKLKKLFTTEDGLDIFENDDFFATYEYNKFLSKPHLCSATKSFDKDRWIKCFASKEKAEEYILMNKPCLSLNDVISLTSRSGFYNESDLEKLVKSKL